MKTVYICILVFFAMTTIAFAETLQVATIERKPFVFKNAEGGLTGFSIEL